MLVHSASTNHRMSNVQYHHAWVRAQHMAEERRLDLAREVKVGPSCLRSSISSDLRRVQQANVVSQVVAWQIRGDGAK